MHIRHSELASTEYGDFSLDLLDEDDRVHELSGPRAFRLSQRSQRSVDTYRS